ncbi:MAG: AraC family transcriptional regulator [Lachnospiraceae bacterium]|nr:AraC family transcriptional regulator [Lachnospiraceae bacterium]
MKYYPNTSLKYEQGFSIVINNMTIPIENSTCYFFDYDKRSQSVNMEFPHFHIFYEMMILLSPKANHFVEGKCYDMIANDIILLPPSVLHQSVYLPGPPSDRIVIGFMLPKQDTYTNGYSEILSVFNTAQPIYRFHREEQNRLFSRLNEITEMSRNIQNPGVRNLMIHCKFMEFLFLLYSIQNHNQYAPSPENGLKDKMYTITNYIHTHYGEKISLASIADTFYISPYYLSHRFKEVTGYTVVEYIQLTRVKNAQYLLLNSDNKITRISEQTGFSSFSQFNRVFRKFCGMSPSDYKISAHNQTIYGVTLPKDSQ